MSVALKKIENTSVGVGVSSTPEGLMQIQQPGCAAVIWQRKPLANFQNWIDGLTPEQLPHVRTVLPAHGARAAVEHICNVCGTPNCTERDHLIDDAAAMAAIFGEVMQTSHVRLRFDVVNDNACRKFHIDAVTARLICTYRGSGTQYGFAPDGEQPDNVHSVSTGSAMLLRGTKWLEQPAAGLLHRSPPIEGTDETRLLLVLDPVADAGAEQTPEILH